MRSEDSSSESEPLEMYVSKKIVVNEHEDKRVLESDQLSTQKNTPKY